MATRGWREWRGLETRTSAEGKSFSQNKQSEIQSVPKLLWCLDRKK
jgi:hypothetical protein